MLFLKFIFKNLIRNKKKFLLTFIVISFAFSILIYTLATQEFYNNLVDEDSSSSHFLIEPNLHINDSSIFEGEGSFVSSDNGGGGSSISSNTDGGSSVLLHYDKNYLDKFYSKFKSVSGVDNLFCMVHGGAINLNSGVTCFNYFINSSDLNKLNITINEGKIFSNSSQLIIEKNLAKEENKNIGDKLDINGKTYEISGIFEGNNYFSGSIIRSLDIWKNSHFNSSGVGGSDLGNSHFNSSDVNEEFGYLVFIGNFTKDINKNQIDKLTNSINSIDSNWIYENSFKESQYIQLTDKMNNELYLTIGAIIIFINVIVLSYNFISSIDEKLMI